MRTCRVKLSFEDIVESVLFYLFIEIRQISVTKDKQYYDAFVCQYLPVTRGDISAWRGIDCLFRYGHAEASMKINQANLHAFLINDRIKMKRYIFNACN